MKVLIDLSIFLFVLASAVQIVVDWRDIRTPAVPVLSALSLPSDDVASLVAATGLALVVVGTVLTLPRPDTIKLTVALVALVSFALVGGYLVDSDVSAA